jgi:hypothetical protein
MSNTTYSREFLQGYKDEYRRKVVDQIISQWTGEILTKAQQGCMEWSYDIGAWRRGQDRSCLSKSHSLTYVPTDADIAEGFLRRFPGCDVTFSEDWIEVRTGTRELQTRITLSWK